MLALYNNTRMTSLENFAAQISNLAKVKGWGNDTIWLMYGCFKEIGELCQTVENYEAKKLRLDCPHCQTTSSVTFREAGICESCRKIFTLEQIRKMFIKLLGSEFAGAQHYILQLVKQKAPELNLDEALGEEIMLNYTRDKKTFIDGSIVRK